MERMKRRWLLIGMLTLPGLAVAQVDLSKAPWKNLPCEKGETQREMNICSGKKAQIADSVMTVLYQKILIHLETALKEESKRQKPGKLDQDYAQNLRSRIGLMKKSQQDFDVYAKSMTGFISEQYSGGSIQPLMMNLWRLGLIEDRIKSLNTLIKELKIG